ncbi:MAG: PAS domain S-box protein [Nitrospirae bacterium]|nr:PAS domain S-box protein [Nitrospirota bacterium]
MLTWCRKRTAWDNLFFSLTAVGTAGLAFCELWMMRAETPEQFATALRWLHVPVLAIIVALVGFVLIYLRAGRHWLAWAVCVLRTCSLLLNFLVGQNLNYREVTGLRHIPFFGESVSVAEGVANPWMLVGQLSLVLFVVFVADATITVWRRGDRRLALVNGGSIVFFVLAGTVQALLVLWEIVHWPLTASFFFMAIVAVMAYEISGEAQRAAQLADDLRESETRLTLAADSVGAILWDLDMDSGCIRITDKAREFFGFAKDRKICAEDFLNVVHPADRAGLLRDWEETMQSGIETSTEYRIVRPDMSVSWILARRRPHPVAAYPVRHMMGVAIDITNQKRIEEELRESENRLRGVLESTADGILGVDSTGRVIIRNSRFNEMWRIPAELGPDADDNTLLSHVMGQLSKPADFLSKVRALYDSYAEDIDLLHFKDGRIFERYSRPIFLPEWVMGRVWSFRDITERQRLAGRLISAQEEELRRLSRELHDDLTQRLAVLAIGAGKLEVELGKLPEACRKVSQIKDQLIRVSEDVHAISRQLHPTILDDLGLVRAIESECATLMRRDNFEIVFEFFEVSAAIPKDAALCLYRIVQEGLKNIVRHSNARDAEIFLRGTEDGICLTIADNGVGFDPAEVRHRPGLGLSSMRERVSLVGGEYSIESQPGNGTVINVCVPLAGSSA